MKSFNRSASGIGSGVTLVFALAVSLPAFAQGKDELWEISTRMEMPGMPMAMPGQTSRVCVGKNRKDEDLVPKQGDCRMVDSKRAGNKFTYTMDCAGNDPSTVAGEVTFGNNAYDGKMRMTMKQTKDTMDMTYAGKRVGDCAAPAK